MQLNSNSFSSGRASRRRPEPELKVAQPWMSLRRGVWLVLTVMLLFAVASVVPSWFLAQPEPVQSTSVSKPARGAGAGMKARIKSLFGPAPGQRLNG